MKVVINKCYGGFGLSRKAVRRMAELQGRPCYFFRMDLKTEKYAPLEDWERPVLGLFVAYDIPNPNETFAYPKGKTWPTMTSKERAAFNELVDSHSHESRPKDRSDPHLVQAVEELGEEANGEHAKLRVVEIPDGVEYEIHDYDGMERVDEVHRSWG